MKRLLIAMVVLLIGGTALAQNVIGDPVYYTDSTQYRPGHGMGYDNLRGVHPYNHSRFSRGNDFNKVFLEGRAMLGVTDVAYGFDLSYVPEKWGGYMCNLWGANYDYISFGGVYRLSDTGAARDWQLYGGLLFGPSTGLEGGIRVAFDNFGRNNFSWWSASIGFGSIQGYGFLNVGLSVGLSGLALFELI